ncbi:hypothetical protein [Breoghania sp.]|uniref:hypothetical protein n=1 Tax=Breoghania sp. TaxID=2065378 RepID=UPI002629F5D1|nr:hypothetical protein [Breoghania sp.]MDJ0929840.1 hypothetical protein [Breoghania sp.]
MSLTGTVAALRSKGSSNDGFWGDLRDKIERLHVFSRVEELSDLLQGPDILQAIVVDGYDMKIEDFVGLVRGAERAPSKHDIPLVCLAEHSFRKPEAIRPEAILTHPIPPITVINQIHSLARLKTKKIEASVRTAALEGLDIEVPRPAMPISGGCADNRPALLVVGMRGSFSQIESVLGAKVQIVTALTADMANLYLG